MAEWLKATDCKSVHESVRWFESTPAHIKRMITKLSFFLFTVQDENRFLRFERESADTVVKITTTSRNNISGNSSYNASIAFCFAPQVMHFVS